MRVGTVKLIRFTDFGSGNRDRGEMTSGMGELSSLDPLGSSLTEFQRVEGRLVQIGSEGLTEDSRGGDLVRTWHRLMCHALAEVLALILEQQRLRR